jgi:hypothetical protein
MTEYTTVHCGFTRETDDTMLESFQRELEEHPSFWKMSMTLAKTPGGTSIGFHAPTERLQEDADDSDYEEYTPEAVLMRLAMWRMADFMASQKTN